MSKQLANIWRSRYASLSMNDEANKRLSAFSKPTWYSGENVETDLVRSLTGDPDIVVLALAPITSQIKLYHSLANLGGTRLKPEHKIVGLEGFGPLATAVLFDTDTLTTKFRVRSPTFNLVQTITDPANVVSTSSTYSPSAPDFDRTPFIILPPLISTLF